MSAVKDRKLTADEVTAANLPTGGCCCDDHGHGWYSRTDERGSWLECVHCSDYRTEATR